METPLVAENASENLEIISYVLNNLPYDEHDTSEVLEVISYILNNLPYDELNGPDNFGNFSFISNSSPYDQFNATDGTNKYQSYIACKVILESWDNGYPNDPVLKSWHQIWESRQHISEVIKQHTGKRICEMLLNFPTGIDEHNNNTLQNLLDYAKCLNSKETLMERQRKFLEFINDLIDCYLNRAQRDAKKKMIRQKRIEAAEARYNVELDMMGDRSCLQVQRTWIDSIYVKKDCKNQPQKVVQYFPGIDELNVSGKGMPLTARPRRCSRFG